MIIQKKLYSISKNIFQKINQNNINKGFEIFNESLQNFGDSMEKLTQELNQPTKNNIKIWSDKEENNSQKSKDQINLEKIWGKRNE